MPDIRSVAKNLRMLSLMLMILSTSVHSQQDNLAFETLSLGQGAPTHVSCILQDKTGFMWIGTWSGLYRCDGYSVISYKHDPDDTSSIADNMLSTLYVDKAGVLWIGSRLGLERLDQASGTFKHYTPNPSATGSDAGKSVWHICEGKDGGLWIATGDGLARFDKGRGEFTYLRHDSTDFGSVSMGTIYEDSEGTLWFGTAIGLARYDFETGKFTYCWSDPSNRHKLGINSTSIHWIYAICEDDTGILWLGTSGGLVEYNPKEGTFANYRYGPMDPLNPQHPGNRITSICQDVVSGALWIGSHDGLFLFDRKSKTFVRTLDEGINSVYSERSGTLWLGTNTAIKKLNRTRLPFKRYPMGDIACALVNGNGGALWIYAYKKGGWLQFDTRTEQFVPYSFGTDYLYYVYPEGDLSLLTRDGSFYIRDTLGNRVFFLGPSWKDFNHSFSYGWKTSRGYYVGTHAGGLYLFDPRTQGVTEVNKLTQGIYCIYEDTFGFLWIATRGGGLFCYDQAKNTFAEVSLPTTETLHVEAQERSIRSMRTRKRRLWFATISGLDRYERSTNSFSHFTERDGLPSDNIRGILEDGHGYLWLNTPKGIVKFDPETHHFKTL